MQRATAWLLIVGFLLQPVLGYLVTPVVTHDAKGQTVVVCTLQGERRVTLEFPPIVDKSSDQQDAEHCSALKLYQLSSMAHVSAPPFAPSLSLYAVAVAGQTADRSHRSLHFSAYSTRAPPRFA